MTFLLHIISHLSQPQKEQLFRHLAPPHSKNCADELQYQSIIEKTTAEIQRLKSMNSQQQIYNDNMQAKVRDMQVLVRDMKVRNEQRRLEMEIKIRQAVEERVQKDNEGARLNDKFDQGYDGRVERRNFHQDKIERQRMNKDMGGRKINDSEPNNFRGHDDRNS